jgi:HEAT repeat protein
MLCHTNISIRRDAALALGNIDTRTSREVLALALRDGDLNVRAGAAEALRFVGDGGSISALTNLVAKELVPFVHLPALEALGWIGDVRAKPVLEKSLRNLDPKVRESACRALGYLSDTNASHALMTALDDKETGVREEATTALAQLHDPIAVPSLERRLADEEDYVRLRAAVALTFAGRTNGLQVLTQNLGSTIDWHRFQAIMSLIRMDTPEARSLLKTCEQDPHPRLRALAVRSLAGEGAQALTQLLLDKDPWTRLCGLDAVLLFRDPAAIPALREAVRREEDGTLMLVGARQALRILLRGTGD